MLRGRRVLTIVTSMSLAASGCDSANDRPTQVQDPLDQGAGSNPLSVQVDFITLTAADNGRQIEIVGLGRMLVVQLPGNPTSGYNWEVDAADADVLATMGEPVFVASTSLLGSGGDLHCRFRTVGYGVTDLRLAYRRSWENAAADSFAARIGVRRPPTVGLTEPDTSLDDVTSRGLSF